MQSPLPNKPKAGPGAKLDSASPAPNNADQPPAPPPRTATLSPTPPPPPSRSLKLNLPAALTSGTDSLKQTQLNVGPTATSLVHQIHSLNLRESLYTCLPPEYRHSPSSGFYSCSTSVGSASPLPVAAPSLPSLPTVAPSLPVAASTAVVVVHSVKSTHVEKPRLQTAVAPNNYAMLAPPPPPYQRATQPPLVEGAVASAPAAPPSYASTMRSLAAQPSLAPNAIARDSAKGVVDARPPSRCKPLLPPPVNERPADAVAPRSPATAKVRLQSPIPERRPAAASDDGDRRDCKVRNYSPQAFKFFMEQHVENVLKSCRQRLYRRMQLEKEMQKIGLSGDERQQMRKMLWQKESNYIRLKRAKMDRSMFEKVQLIGVGAFGEVTLVRKLDTDQLYAMKTLRKADVLRKNQVAHVKAERDILAEADNEWVVKLYFSFQDVENLYFVMEYIPGGDLMSLLMKLGIFEEDLARFYLAELTCAVESVHLMGFIHRDIKPDNILIDRDGHIKLTDFGLCTGFRWTHNSKYYENNDAHQRQDSFDLSEKWNADANCKCSKLKPLERRRRREHQRCLAHSLVGTPNYIAPEVLLRTGYTQLCDWWSVGVVLYEMLMGKPPFSADTPLETQHKIIRWQSTLEIPTNVNVSPAAVDLILKLCTGSERRLGKNANEVKEHPFLAGIDFGRGVRKLTPPYVPKIRHQTDTSNFDPIHADSEDSRSFSSSSVDSSSQNGDADSEQFHGFFEFTFRRFFDGGGVGGVVPFPAAKIYGEDGDSPGAIYV